MARLSRLYFPGCSHHIIQRGNNRTPCFYEEQDYAVYLDKLKEASRKYHVDIHAFVLMSNHVHLLATPANDTAISRMMQAMGRYYVRYVNQTYGRTGTLWEGRYKSTLVDSEHYHLAVSRYIELNPVRAKMVEHPSQYPWSSYRHNAMGRSIALLTPHATWLALGKTGEERRAAYRLLFRGRMAEKAIQEIRDATNKSWVLSEDRFRTRIEKATGRPAAPRQRGGDRKSRKFQADGLNP